jgi:hypothetical protein
MTKKNEWEIERDMADTLRENAVKSLTSDQLNAINKTYKTLETVLDNIKVMEDICLSDIRNLNNAFWKLKHGFNLGDE